MAPTSLTLYPGCEYGDDDYRLVNSYIVMAIPGRSGSGVLILLDWTPDCDGVSYAAYEIRCDGICGFQVSSILEDAFGICKEPDVNVPVGRRTFLELARDACEMAMMGSGYFGSPVLIGTVGPSQMDGHDIIDGDVNSGSTLFHDLVDSFVPAVTMEIRKEFTHGTYIGKYRPMLDEMLRLGMTESLRLEANGAGDIRGRDLAIVVHYVAENNGVPSVTACRTVDVVTDLMSTEDGIVPTNPKVGDYLEIPRDVIRYNFQAGGKMRQLLDMVDDFVMSGGELR